MRIAILGAGNVGCHIGGHLACVAEVSLIARPAAAERLRERGITLTSSHKPARHISPSALDISTDPCAAAVADVVLITVKSRDTIDAARSLSAHLGPDSIVISFQNGLRNHSALRAELNLAYVLAGIVPYNIVEEPSCTFHQGSPGTLLLEEGQVSHPFTALLNQAGLPTQTSPDIDRHQLAKLLVNLNNAVNALSGLPLRDQLAQRPYRACLAMMQREALTAFRAAGLHPARYTRLPAAAVPYLLQLPDRWYARLTAADVLIDDKACSSMWDDLRCGRPTEIDSLQGEIVSLAAQHSRTAPACARIIELIRAAETAPHVESGRWSGPSLLAELRSAQRARE